MDTKEKKRPVPLTVELADTDRALVRLLLKRSRLLQKLVASRQQAKRSLVDPALEKRLWDSWREELQEQAAMTRNWRLLFDLANELAYSQKQPDKAGTGFLLAPSRSEARIDSAGPPDMESARLWILAARLADAPLHLEPVILNDPVVDCIKAMNQLGGRGGLSWDRQSITHDPAPHEKAQGKGAVFVGGDRLNIFLLICLSTTTSGTVKFTGDMDLKRFDLGPSREVLRQLGARATSLAPGGAGLPLRLETSGMPEREISIPFEAPQELALALPLAATAFPDGLTLRWDRDWPGARMLPKALSVLKTCAVDVVLGATHLLIPRSDLKVPPRTGLAIDPLLAAPFLALPGISGGRVALRGSWPSGQPEADVLVDLLHGFGCLVQPGQDAIESRPGTSSLSEVMDISTAPRLLPLATALAVLLPRTSTILLPENSPDLRYCRGFLTELGQEHRLQDGALIIEPFTGPGARKRTFTTPHPLWSLALSLTAFARSGILLSNPGDMARAWPRYWSAYRNLPAPGDLLRLPHKEEPQRPSGEHHARRRFHVD